MTRRRALGWLAALPLAGCGSGSSGPGEFVTREIETTLDRDALALTSRDSEGVWLPLGLARSLDADLRAIRKAFPATASVHAQVGFDPHELHVAVASAASWNARWRSGQLITGELELDTFLGELNATAVRLLEDGGDRAWFGLTFSQWLRMKAVAFLMYTKSPSVLSVSLVQRVEPDTDIGLWRSDDNRTLRLDFDGIVYERTGGGLWHLYDCVAAGDCVK